MAYNNLLTEIKNRVFYITINRPDKLNALNRETIHELSDAVDAAHANSDVRGIIITGAGNKSFVAGADISEFLGLSAEEGQAMAVKGQQVFSKFENSGKPVIAAVNGFALGGGCELAMSCHIRIASENAKFGQPEVNLGLIAGYGGTQRLTQYIGKSKAYEMHITADMINAQEALHLGLVNYVVPFDGLMAKCEEIMEKIKSKSPNAVARAIAAMNAYFNHATNGFEAEADEFGKCFGHADFKEGTSAFLEKRKPNF
jgi:enoyl-CoA hydratase